MVSRLWLAWCGGEAGADGLREAAEGVLAGAGPALEGLFVRGCWADPSEIAAWARRMPAAFGDVPAAVAARLRRGPAVGLALEARSRARRPAELWRQALAVEDLGWEVTGGRQGIAIDPLAASCLTLAERRRRRERPPELAPLVQIHLVARRRGASAHTHGLRRLGLPELSLRLAAGVPPDGLADLVFRVAEAAVQGQFELAPGACLRAVDGGPRIDLRRPRSGRRGQVEIHLVPETPRGASPLAREDYFHADQR